MLKACVLCRRHGSIKLSSTTTTKCVTIAMQRLDRDALSVVASFLPKEGSCEGVHRLWHVWREAKPLRDRVLRDELERVKEKVARFDATVPRREWFFGKLSVPMLEEYQRMNKLANDPDTPLIQALLTLKDLEEWLPRVLAWTIRRLDTLDNQIVGMTFGYWDGYQPHKGFATPTSMHERLDRIWLANAWYPWRRHPGPPGYGKTI